MARSAAAARPAPARRPARGTPLRRPRPLRAAPAPAPAPRARRARAGLEWGLDTLLRGRVWIAFVGLLLFGIVFLNVTLLQRNRETALTAERATELKRANEGLRSQLARLASNERVQAAAARRGFALPAPAQVGYLRAGAKQDVTKALARVRGAGQETAAGAPGVPVAGAVPETAEQAPATPPAEAGFGEGVSDQAEPTGAPPAAAAPLPPGTGQ